MLSDSEHKMSVVVLFGGMSSEHEVSRVSAGTFVDQLDHQRYELLTIGITKEGRWLYTEADSAQMADGSWEELPGNMPCVLSPDRADHGMILFTPDGRVEKMHLDVVIPVLHGLWGEDGTVQGLLEMMDVPYVGCGVFASAACMDKHYTKIVLNAAGIPTAPGIMVDARHATGESVYDEVKKAKLAYPLFVKPSRAGSSFGVTKVEQADDEQAQIAALEAAVAEAGKHDWKVLVEQGIDAREIECAVLCAAPGDEPEASWPGEIVLDHRDQGDDQFYDFDSKYMDSSASHVEVPANLPVSVLEDVRDVARRAFAAVDGAGLSRVDTFVTPDGTVMVNEINTMPGFTPISMYPKAWDASGIGYTELITRLIEGVLR